MWFVRRVVPAEVVGRLASRGRGRHRAVGRQYFFVCGGRVPVQHFIGSGIILEIRPGIHGYEFFVLVAPERGEPFDPSGDHGPSTEDQQ